MSKHATMASTANMRTKAKPAAAKARFSTTTKWIAGAGVLVLALGGAIIAAMPEPGATKLATSESRAAASPTSAGTLSALTSKFNLAPCPWQPARSRTGTGSGTWAASRC